jgi:hypothetical protein
MRTLAHISDLHYGRGRATTDGLSVGFGPFHKVGFGYATVGVPSYFRFTLYHLNPSYHNERWIAVGSGLVFIYQHRIRWI